MYQQNKQLANVPIKLLSRRWFEQLVDKLGMFNLYRPTWGGVLEDNSNKIKSF